MSAEEQTISARVGKKARAGRQNSIFDPNAAHARIANLAKKKSFSLEPRYL